LTTPTLIFGWGNPSRGDDALAPLLVERIAALHLPGVECLTDFQLQVEHALDLTGRSRILFVDASVAAAPPFAVSVLKPVRDTSFSTHAMTPQAVMQVYVDLHDADPPPCTLLAIRGDNFDLGAGLGGPAQKNLDAAVAWVRHWLT
jgi:hydrogenase maturation protease